VAIDIKKFVIRFIEEARDHVARLNEGLAAMEAGVADKERINAVLRSAHTIKGSSRMLKLQPITETAHRLEDVLDALRGGQIQFNAALAQTLYRGVDAIAGLVDRLAETHDGTALPVSDAVLCAALAAAATGTTGVTGATGAAEPAAGEATELEPVSASPMTNAVAPKLKAPDTVRVRLTKLDQIVKLMGEVVSSHARMRQRLLDIRALEKELAGVAAMEPYRAQLHEFALRLKDDVQAQESLMDELHDKTLVMRMLPLAMIFDSAGRLIRDLAESVGKRAECVVIGAEIELDRQMIDRLADPLIHLLRNAVDHGLESPVARQAAGKPVSGQIRLSAHQDGGWVVIEVADDGGGIPLAQVREKAARKGFITAEKAATLSEQETIDLIFLPGFSTNTIITDLSGRGVGMDVVKQCIVDELRGSVSVTTRPGLGTRFALRLPLSLAVMRVLVVQVAGLPFAFTAQYVAELLRVPRSDLMRVAERDAVIVRNEFVPVVSLAELLHVPNPGDREGTVAGKRGQSLLLLVLRVRGEKIALVIDDLVDERDMVIKPLPEHMRQHAMLSGMVVTGKSELVSVLHPPALLELARTARRQSVQGEASRHASQAKRIYNVLVVDDSLNTREIEKDVLEAWGYHVTLAEDGLDGLKQALAGDFDAILTDVEMPAMDGFTLTARLREEERYRHRPIVIVTSREKEEDKRRGIEVGADAYIVKGNFEQSRLVDTLKALLG